MQRERSLSPRHKRKGRTGLPSQCGGSGALAHSACQGDTSDGAPPRPGPAPVPLGSLCNLSPFHFALTETMTMFENVTRALARQLNPRGDLTPLDSLIDFKRFHPFCLVLRKRKSTLFWGARYVRTDYTLLDVLQPGSAPSGEPRPGL